MGLWSNIVSDSMARRIVAWTALCIVIAGPSFFLGQGHNREAMLCGVALFVLAHTAIFGSGVVRSLWADRRSRRTIQIGYGTLAGFTIVFPAGIVLHMIPGILSFRMAEGLFTSPQEFAGTLLATLIQGILLSGILATYMMVVSCLQGPSSPEAEADQVCRKCGYDLRGTPHRCPECGTIVRSRPDQSTG